MSTDSGDASQSTRDPNALESFLPFVGSFASYAVRPTKAYTAPYAKSNPECSSFHMAIMPPHYRTDSTFGYKETVDSTAAAQTHAGGRNSSSPDRSRLSDTAVTATTAIGPVLERHETDAARTASTERTTSGSAPRKSRVTLACKRCKRRKQRVSDAPH